MFSSLSPIFNVWVYYHLFVYSCLTFQFLWHSAVSRLHLGAFDILAFPYVTAVLHFGHFNICMIYDCQLITITICTWENFLRIYDSTTYGDRNVRGNKEKRCPLATYKKIWQLCFSAVLSGKNHHHMIYSGLRSPDHFNCSSILEAQVKINLDIDPKSMQHFQTALIRV